MKKFLSIRFLITLIISSLVFSGIETLLDDLFEIELDNVLTFGGVGFIVLLGLKFHIFCCVIPVAISTLLCVRRKHNHCDCEHDHSSQKDLRTTQRETK